MISHERAQRLLSARLDELLPPADHRALQEHLATCPDCRLFARQAETLMHDLRGLPFLPPSPAVSRAVMAEIRDSSRGLSPLAWLGGLRFSPGPALAVVSSFVLIAALAYTVSIALRPANDRLEPAATAASIAIAPKTTPTPQPIAAPTEAPLPPVQQLVPTTAAAVAPTRSAEAAPTATRPVSIQAPPTPTPTFAATEPPVEQPAIVVATEAPVEPAPTDAPQLAQGDTTQSMDLAQTARKGDKTTGQQAEAQSADSGQPVEGAVDAALAPAATDTLAADTGAGTGSDAGTYDAAIQPTIAPADATPPPDENVSPTIAPSQDEQQSGEPQSQPGAQGDQQDAGADQGGTDAGGAVVGPPTPTLFPTLPAMPNGFGDGGKMQVSLTAGQNGKPASISVIPVPPTPTPVPTATPTPDPAQATMTPTPASGDAAPADGTPAGQSS